MHILVHVNSPHVPVGQGLPSNSSWYLPQACCFEVHAWHPSNPLQPLHHKDLSRPCRSSWHTGLAFWNSSFSCCWSLMNSSSSLLHSRAIVRRAWSWSIDLGELINEECQYWQGYWCITAKLCINSSPSILYNYFWILLLFEVPSLPHTLFSGSWYNHVCGSQKHAKFRPILQVLQAWCFDQNKPRDALGASEENNGMCQRFNLVFKKFQEVFISWSLHFLNMDLAFGASCFMEGKRKAEEESSKDSKATRWERRETNAFELASMPQLATKWPLRFPRAASTTDCGQLEPGIWLVTEGITRKLWQQAIYSWGFSDKGYTTPIINLC